jgi:hypothetical protein
LGCSAIVRASPAKGSAQDHDSEQDLAISHGAAFLTTNKKKGRQIPEAFMDS